MDTKTESIVCIVICILAAIIIRTLANFNVVFVIEILIFIPGFIVSYILTNILDIRIHKAMFCVIVLLSFFLVKVFAKSSIAFNISIADWEKTAMRKINNECLSSCKIKDRAIYDENNVEIYRWFGLSYIYDGYIKKVDGFLEYKLSLKDKCIVKEINKEYKILDGECN